MSFNNHRPLRTSATLMAAAVSAVMLAAAPAWSQGSTTGPGAGSTGTMGATGSSAKGMEPSTGASKGAMSAQDMKISKADSKMMGDLAQGNMAEIETGKLALEKSPSDATKKFAQMMIDDHTKALGDVQKLADSKGVTLPKEPSIGQKAEATALKAMSGNTFDKQYRSHAGVGDHQRTVALLQKIQKNAKDADFKALADKMLPTVQGHLAMAKQLNNEKKS